MTVAEAEAKDLSRMSRAQLREIADHLLGCHTTGRKSKREREYPVLSRNQWSELRQLEPLVGKNTELAAGPAMVVRSGPCRRYRTTTAVQ